MLNKFLKPEAIFVITIIILCAVLIIMPNGFEKDSYDEYIRSKALIMSTDNSDIVQMGIIKTGTQDLKIRILDGKFKGHETEATNHLLGKLEVDKMFKEGDKALVSISYEKDKIIAVNVLDHYRINIEMILFAIFIIILIAFAGWTGAKAVISFVFTILMIWKILLPLFLKGWNPIFVSFAVVVVLIAVIIFLVAGLTSKGLVAFLGSISGILVTCVFALIFGKGFNIHGAVIPFSETLLHSGYGHLQLTSIFLSGIFIASSGAIMDIAMDIAASMNEVIDKRPDMTRRELILSGFTVGKAVIGTMTTTLLLAYSGGYTALLMIFLAQGTPVINILNITFVSAEILHTLVGSFGLVLVAPFTAVLGGFIFKCNTQKVDVTEETKEVPQSSL